ncbi:MAG: hypothetical protein U9R43_00770 [Thermodesulfobacteriota bacterium]|nr:hypothetical protein [Thermodesulfobacteriota bacterium]
MDREEDLKYVSGHQGTWYEYGTIVKMLKNISAYSKSISNSRWKNCKGKQIKTIAK